MRTTTRVSAGALATFTVVTLSGCYSNPEYEEQRLTNLTSAVDEFSAEAIADVICDVKGGELGLKTGFTRLLVLADADSLQPVLDRFESLGYDMTSTAPRLSGFRSDGLSVAGRLIERPGSEPDMEEDLVAKECEPIPSVGAVVIQWEESG